MSFYRCLFINLLIFVVFFTGCTPAKKYRLLSFFFDGVPSPESHQVEQLKEIEIPSEIPVEQKIVEPELASQHPPYVEHECESCHRNQFSQKLQAEGKDLCFSCHDDFLSGKEVPHAPVEEGCLDCHLPHVSKNKSLLIRSGQALCFECHDQQDLLKVEPHTEIGETNCIECHDPHAGGEKLLK